MDKFQDFFRIPSARANWWNYDSPGIYFITICSAFRECIFGSIVSDVMILAEPGKIVMQEWEKSFQIRSELFCDAFVIMPNHIHSVLRIVSTDENKTIAIAKEKYGSMDASVLSFVKTTKSVSPKIKQPTEDACSKINPMVLPNNHGVAYRPPKSISSFVAGFKSAATTQINDFRKMPGITVWQTRFHDHIIRDDIEYLKIIRYIKSNPKNWKEDRYYK